MDSACNGQKGFELHYISCFEISKKKRNGNNKFCENRGRREEQKKVEDLKSIHFFVVLRMVSWRLLSVQF